MTFQLLVILTLTLANALLAMSEIAIVSARKARLQQWSNEGDAKARIALDLANNPSRFLATIQVGITLINILTAAYGGATIGESLAHRLNGIPYVGYYAGFAAISLVVAGLTFLQVVLGELVPKAVALNHAERIASFMAIPMRLLSRLASPVVSLFEGSTRITLRVMGVKQSAEPPVTGEEINVMVAQGTEAGVFEEAQQDMVENIIDLSERRVNTLMTPRPDIVWLDVEDAPEIIRSKMLESPYSRFPVCRGGLDHVLGVVHTKDLLGDCMEGRPIDFVARVKKALHIPETIPALKSLELFRESGSHIALVIDEYGGVQGLVTLTDVMESIVGDVAPPEDSEEPQAIRREDGSWLVDGMQLIEDFKETLSIDNLPGEDEATYQTLGGFVMTQLGRIPKAGEAFSIKGWRFEVMDMDGNRVDKVLVRAEEPRSADATSVEEPREGREPTATHPIALPPATETPATQEPGSAA